MRSGIPFFLPSFGALLALSLALGAPRADAEPLVDPGGQALDRFYASLARVEAKQATLSRVVQLGDSHTACDLWTGALRRRLQARLGDGGHGFVIPRRPWAQYRHLDVGHAYNDGYWKVTRLRPGQATVAPLGLGGVALDAKQDHARVRVVTSERGPVGRTAALIDLFYLQQPGGGTLRIRIDGRQVLDLSTSMATRAPAFRLFELPDGPHQLEIDTVGRGPVRLYGVVFERRGPGVVIDSVGLPGLRAIDLLASEAATLRAQLTRRNPDLLVLAFGSVEANQPDFDLGNYPEEVSRVVAHLRQGAPLASCLLLAPVDRARRERGGTWRSPPLLDGVVLGLREAAARSGCAFWDTRAAMGGGGSIHDWYLRKLAQPDHVHLNREGYEALAGLLESALLEGYGAFKRRPGPEATPGR